MNTARHSMRSKRLNQEGQSTLEFAMSLVLLMAFSFFFIQLSLVFAFGNYVHYATFMSARAYLSSGPNLDDQQQRAKDVINHMLKKGGGGQDRFKSIGQGVGNGDVKGLVIELPSQEPGGPLHTSTSSWMMGVRYTFRSKLFVLPLEGLGSQVSSSVNQLTLTSESWLGHEPAYEDCKGEMGDRIFDNGC